MTTLFSWLGVTDFRAREKTEPKDQGCALVSIARDCKPRRLVLLWGDSVKTPLSEQQEFLYWYRGQFADGNPAPEVDVRPIAGGEDRVMDYSWIWEQVDQALKDEPEGDGDFINASSGTPVMTAVWIIRQKAFGGRARLLVSSKEQGVSELALPPTLNISIAELLSGRPSSLMKRVLAGETRLLNPSFEGVVGHSAALKLVKVQAEQAARYPFPLLITGPAGSGKSVLAEAIHQASPRADKPLVPVDCGTLVGERAIGELFGWEKGAFTGAEKPFVGQFRLAHQGTLFLDEVGNLPMPAQQLLLRALQTRKVRPLAGTKDEPINVRIIAATNTDLRQAVRKGSFRADLLDRLSRLTIRVPALSERREDIVAIAERFLKQFNDEYKQEMESDGVKWPKKFGSGVDRVLRAHSWPGNVRELEHVVTRAVLQTAQSDAEEIGVDDVRAVIQRDDLAVGLDAGVLTEELGNEFSLESALSKVRTHYMQRALQQAGGVQSAAAALLGMNRPTFIRQAKLAGVLE